MITQDKGNVFPLTVMADPRIVRGNTHSLAKKISLQTQLEIKDSLNTTVISTFFFLQLVYFIRILYEK